MDRKKRAAAKDEVVPSPLGDAGEKVAKKRAVMKLLFCDENEDDNNDAINQDESDSSPDVVNNAGQEDESDSSTDMIRHANELRKDAVHYTSRKFEESLKTAGLSTDRSAFRAVHAIVGKMARRMYNLEARNFVAETIAQVQERALRLRAFAARVDVHSLPLEAELTTIDALEGLAPLTTALPKICAWAVAVATNDEATGQVSWRTKLAARCTPVAAELDDETVRALKDELASLESQELESVFGFDETHRMAWLVGAFEFDIGTAVHLEKFDAALLERGIVEPMSEALASERVSIFGGRTTLEMRVKRSLARLRAALDRARSIYGLHGILDVEKGGIVGRIVDCEATATTALVEVLASDLLRDEAHTHSTLNDIVRRYNVHNLRDAILNDWYNADVEGPFQTKFASRAVSQHRVQMLRALVQEGVCVSWNNTKQVSTVVRWMCTKIANGLADDRPSEIIVGEAAARAKILIAQWKAGTDRWNAVHSKRKAKLDQMLLAHGYDCEGFAVVRYRDLSRIERIEIDIRRDTDTAIDEFDTTIGTSINGKRFFMRMSDNSVVHELPDWHSRGKSMPVDTAVVARGVWRAAMLNQRHAQLRWPPRLNSDDLIALENVVVNTKLPVRIPDRVVVRSARRARLLAALRAYGLPDSRIPLGATADNGPLFHFLTSEQWPRSRDTAASLVGDVAMAMRGDIFAALPMLALLRICDFVYNGAHLMNLSRASDAFALAVAVWCVDRDCSERMMYVVDPLD